ncbi:phage major capsid protein [Streptomyces sp. SHP 1-2]|uniref:phage major capsid protein n=1 Tax=Streptomyces sp. SHP 1-2 TaxID=2769489 RepID=UPI002238F432|nr:phage major capsid protein [Streptomyces sp. SHP 1-2]MCW5252219.1 phage major capsid protein [Streptomyces sp. SHP 1-2]
MSALLTRALEKRANLWSQMQEIQSRAETENRDALTAEERETWDRMEADLTATSQDIERMERSARMDAVQRDQAVVTTGGGRREDHDGEGQEAAYRDAFGRFVRRGMTALSNEQRELMLANHSEIRAQATSPASAGGYFIPTDTLAKITETMKVYGGLMSEVNIITTASGNSLNWPTNDDTANVGAILTENSQVTEQDITLGQKELGAYTYTSKMIRASLALLQDSAFDTEGFIARKLGERIGRAIAAHLATGTGTSQPLGLFTNATAGVTGAAGQTTSVTYDDLVDLQHSIDPAYRGTAKWATSDAGLKVVRKLKDDTGRPLWEPSVQAGAPSLLLGAPVVIDNGVPAPAASASSIGYGDLRAAYVARQIAGGQMMRLEERYADYLQVGFLGFLRFDGTTDDGAAFRVYKHPGA